MSASMPFVMIRKGGTKSPTPVSWKIRRRVDATAPSSARPWSHRTLDRRDGASDAAKAAARHERAGAEHIARSSTISETRKAVGASTSISRSKPHSLASAKPAAPHPGRGKDDAQRYCLMTEMEILAVHRSDWRFAGSRQPVACARGHKFNVARPHVLTVYTP